MLLLIIFLQNFLAAAYATYSRTVAKHNKDLHWHQTAAVFVILYVLALIYAVPRGNIDILHAFEYLPLLVINGICFGIGTAIAYLAFRDQDAGVVNTNLMIRLPIAGLLAVSILNQSLSVQSVFGAVLVVLAVFLVSYGSSNKISWRPDKSSLYAYLSGALFGIGIITEKLTLNHLNIDTFIVTSWFFEMVFLLLFTLHKPSKWIRLHDRTLLKQTALMGLLRFGGGFLFVWALDNSLDTTLIAASGGLQAIFTVLLAAVFIKETGKIKLKLGTAALACFGIVLMFYS